MALPHEDPKSKSCLKTGVSWNSREPGGDVPGTALSDFKRSLIRPNPETIPTQLKDVPAWVVWRLEDRTPGKKFAKMPYDAKAAGHVKAGVDEPGAWADFRTAWSRYERGGFDGIGIVLTEAAGIVGFDFDRCIGETGEIDAVLLGHIRALDTYAEISPGSRGLRAFAFGDIPDGRRRRGPVEIYKGGRYLTVTGAKLADAPPDIRHREEAVLSVYDALLGEDSAPESSPPPDDARNQHVAGPIDIDERLEKAFNSANGDKIRALFGGEWKSLGYPSQSEADEAFCGHLAFWFGRDAALMDSVFRRSGLFRAKWDRRTGKSTYGAMTIERAIGGAGRIYRDTIPDRPAGMGAAAGECAKQSEEVDEKARREALKAKVEKEIDRVNRKHAVVMVGGKFRVMTEFQNPVTDRPDFTLSSAADFNSLYQNRTVENPRAGAAGQPDRISVSKLWLNSPKRRQYPGGIVFNPPTREGAADVNGFFNLWQGFCIKPKPGDWSLLRRHIWENVVSENEEHFKWLLAWFARLIQDPGGERPGTAIALKGQQGTGKGTLVSQFEDIFGPHFLHLMHSGQLTGNFNGHLKNALLCFLDEGFWGGNKDAEGVLKGLITERSWLCNEKNEKPVTIKSHLNIVLASNNDWFVPTGLEERRFFVLKMSDRHRQDKPYFKAIAHQMNTGGREAFFHDLLHMDISGVDLRTAPKTDALMEQIEHSMTAVQRWLYDCLKDGSFSKDPNAVWESSDPSMGWEGEQLYTIFKQHVREDRPNAFVLAKTSFFRQLKELVPDLDIYRPAKPAGAVRPRRRYVFPTLDECRAAFEKRLQMEIDWDGI